MVRGAAARGVSNLTPAQNGQALWSLSKMLKSSSVHHTVFGAIYAIFCF